MKIKSINIQGFRKCINNTYNFTEDSTYIYGKNGAGKSTILNAIQLALLGYIPGTGKKPKDIMEHSNGKEIKVNLVLEDNESNTITVTRTFTKSGNTARSNVTVDPQVDLEALLGNSTLPIFDWDEFTRLTANNMKEWFIKFLPKQDNEINWKEELLNAYDSSDLSYVNLDELASEYESTINSCTEEDSVVYANTLFKEDLSYNKAALSESENYLLGLTKDYDSSLNVNKKDLEVNNIKIKELTEQIQDLSNNVKKVEANTKRRSALQTEIESIKQEINNVNEEELNTRMQELQELKDSEQSIFDKVKSELDECNNTLDELNYSDKISEIAAKKSNYIKVINSEGFCPFTDLECEDILEVIPTYEQDLANLQKEKERLDKKYEKLKNNVLVCTRTLKDSEFNLQKYTNEINSINNTLNVVLPRWKNIVESDEEELNSIEELDSSELFEQLNNLNEQKSELLHNNTVMLNHIAEQDQITKVTKRVYELREACDVLKAWKNLTSANGLQTAGSADVFKQAEVDLSKELTKLFNEEVSCKFNITAKSNSFSFGIVKDNKYIPYNLLSTGEKTLFAFALMNYIIINSNTSVNVIMLDDFLDHLDDTNFVNMINTVLKDSKETQIIMAGVKPFTDVKSMQVIEL